MSGYMVLNEIVSCYSVTVAILGTIGNLMAAAICLRKSLRSTPTFVFYAVISLTNIVFLYHWNLNNFFLVYFRIVVVEVSVVTCRLTSFLQMAFSQASSYLMVALVLERYLSVKIKNWRNVYFNAKKAILTSLGILSFFILFNIHLLGTLPFQKPVNGTASNICFSSKTYLTWRELHTYAYSMIPFGLLLAFNSFLIYEVVSSSKSINSSENKDAKNLSMSISVITFTLLFIVLTGPFAVIGGYFLSILRTESGRAIIFVCVVIAHTFHGSMLIQLILLNKKFKQEFKQILMEYKILKNNQVGNSTTNRTATIKNTQ